jgi:uncharacterized membrane protein YhaH (DUF805 family)
MGGVLGHASAAGAIHAALVCTTDSVGQTVCTGTSAGFFAGLGILLFVYIAILVLGIVAAVKIVSKAGYSGWWVLIGLVPLVGSIFVLVFAFSTWPVTREVEMLRSQVGSRGYGREGGYGPGPVSGGPGPGIGPVGSTETAPEDISMPSFGQFIRRDAGGADQGQAAAPSQHPPAGWFPAPGGPPGQLRYWDGTTWTDQYR